MPRTWKDEKVNRKRRRDVEEYSEEVPCKSHKKPKHDKPTSSVMLTPPISDEDVDQSSAENKAKDEDAVKGNFKNFSICKASRKVLRSKGVKYLFPIQYKTFDHIYEGKDVIGQARTGTGKTLSFVLPLLERLLSQGTLPTARGRAPIILVMAPTRELANQVNKEFSDLSQELHVACIYGGTPYVPQERAIRQGIDVLVGTPGRILDHMGRGNLDLTKLQCVVLDEADQMLEIGFADTIDEILAASFNEKRTGADKPQMLLFSATVPPWVSDTAAQYMNKDRIEVDLVGRNTVRTAVTVEHKALCCQYSERPSTICDVIQVYSGAHGRSIVFTSTKAEANELALTSALSQQCQVLHGDIQQSQRERTLQSFREGKFSVLVATDVAARGLDIPEVDLVIQCEPPSDVDAYIHRSGRTGRAGRTGTCVMFYKPAQEFLINGVERRAGIKIQRVGPPRPSDIIKAAGVDVIKSIQSVNSDILQHFKDAAQQLIESMGTENALCAALAHISGCGEITSRSLLTSEQGYTTFLLTTPYEIRGGGYFFKAIERKFGNKVKDSIRGLRMCGDSKGAVFDVPKEFASIVKDLCGVFNGMTLSAPDHLPELMARPHDFYQRQYQEFKMRNGKFRNRGSGRGGGRGFGRRH